MKPFSKRTHGVLISIAILSTIIMNPIEGYAEAKEGEPLFPIQKKFKVKKAHIWKQGFMDRSGKIVIEPQFSRV